MTTNSGQNSPTSAATDAYLVDGLCGVMNLYQQFPTRLRSTIVQKQAALWCELWAELTPTEQENITQYVLPVAPTTTRDEVELYRARLLDLETHAAARRAKRITAVLGQDPKTAAASVQSLDEAQDKLINITKELLAAAEQAVQEEAQRVVESSLFSPRTDK